MDRIEATVVAVEPTGSETFILLESASVTFTATFHERVSPREGGDFPLQFDPAELHFFDPENG